ncbi:hypothetical protein MUG78_04510 [Gordonia alkaliphila]|uniref:Uncharacterized protein n=1 Tax=Gordonia alkaliphila TaxID=1053547 RepID=A0ABP8ZGE2_9ACTN|nr:hypothetical protein [Gordonia alkaliphila]MCK0438746.1 hypothetical protein [Gordonia alkaliphila]
MTTPDDQNNTNNPDGNATEQLDPQAQAVPEAPTAPITPPPLTPGQVSPVAPGPVAPAPAPPKNPQNKRAWIIGGAIAAAFAFLLIGFGLGYVTGDLTGDDGRGGHHRSGQEYGPRGGGMRMDGERPMGPMMRGDGQDGDQRGQRPNRSTEPSAPTTPQQSATEQTPSAAG